MKGTDVKMEKEIKITKEINRGITLVSLVITIVVLLILAGITINLTIGHEGIITKATQARENMILAQEEEEKQLNELYKQMLGEIDGETSYDTITKLAEFKKEIAKAITDMGVDTLETASASTMASNIRNISKDASSISYDNSSSTLTSTNVQGAVDELNQGLVPFPDYSNPTEVFPITAGGELSYNVVEDGYYTINISDTGNPVTANIFVYINNATVMSCLMSANYINSTNTFPIKAGSTIRMTGRETSRLRVTKL